MEKKGWGINKERGRKEQGKNRKHFGEDER